MGDRPLEYPLHSFPHVSAPQAVEEGVHYGGDHSIQDIGYHILLSYIAGGWPEIQPKDGPVEKGDHSQV